MYRNDEADLGLEWMILSPTGGKHGFQFGARRIFLLLPSFPTLLYSKKLAVLRNHRRRSRGGRGGRVPPSNFSGGDRPPLDFWKLEKYLFIYLHFKHNESNTKRLIQHKNTTKHTKSVNLPPASRAVSRPNHISASLALPAISVAGEGGGAIPPPPIMLFQSFVGTFRNLSLHVSRQACHLYRQSIWSTMYILNRNSSFRM